MYKRVRQIIRMFLNVAGASLLFLVASAILLIACNCRDAPLPDLSGLEPVPGANVPANSNGWYCIREAVRDSWIPARTASLYAVWCGVRREDAAGLRELLASNTLALAWIDRAANSAWIAPPRVYLPEDGNWLGWSPVARSMMLKRRCANPTCPCGCRQIPSPSGPRWRCKLFIA